jgi:hypothetical protein
MTQAGFTKQSLQGREGEAPLTIDGVMDSTTMEFRTTRDATPGEANNYWNRLVREVQIVSSTTPPLLS